jgi:hypothetical protein
MNSNNNPVKSSEKSCINYLLSSFCFTTTNIVHPTKNDGFREPKDIKMTPEQFWCGTSVNKNG